MHDDLSCMSAVFLWRNISIIICKRSPKILTKENKIFRTLTIWRSLEQSFTTSSLNCWICKTVYVTGLLAVDLVFKCIQNTFEFLRIGIGLPMDTYTIYHFQIFSFTIEMLKSRQNSPASPGYSSNISIAVIAHLGGKWMGLAADCLTYLLIKLTLGLSGYWTCSLSSGIKRGSTPLV